MVRSVDAVAIQPSQSYFAGSVTSVSLGLVLGDTMKENPIYRQVLLTSESHLGDDDI